MLDELAERHAPEPGTDESLVLAAIERLSGLSDQLRQALTDRQWSSIPSIVRESMTSGLNAGDVLNVPPMVQDLVLITRVVISVPPGATATLTLGRETLPNVPAGLTQLNIAHILTAGDVRSLTLAGAGGTASLFLYGEQLAPTGSMAP